MPYIALQAAVLYSIYGGCSRGKHGAREPFCWVRPGVVMGLVAGSLGARPGAPTMTLILGLARALARALRRFRAWSKAEHDQKSHLPDPPSSFLMGNASLEDGNMIVWVSGTETPRYRHQQPN
jgi:hypothetical protein